MGGNNRVLGMSLRAHRDLPTALAEIDVVRDLAVRARFGIEHAETGQWWWRMYGERGELARSAQGFSRRVDAELAAGRFRGRAADAGVEPALAIFQSGRRGRTSAESRPGSAGRTSRDGADVWPKRPVG
ncbi:hypothetical protein F0L68_28025 [Solihabitans fulvus]|uniref:Uncharacterized protein n=1 Tax=Solihabitans fulvus TaxID=1892852 RepID=A0A5B2X021_9PSEU|nr:hypothetical protein [Solihabitans fulvus]KAA2255647.1 hypothetical protein F0L68_28025 [Solihabitans fulvus]